MSDDAPAYINAWTSVMSKPEHHLLCIWHVERSWRTNLNKIKNLKKQQEVYGALRVLLENMDEENFLDNLESFLMMCEMDPETKDFGVYFERYYANRPEQWAFCYRLGLGLNTNMFLEAMHKKLKYYYMHGKQNRRVDKCIGLLMLFARDMMFEKIIRMAKNKPTFRMKQIARSHHSSKAIEDGMIEAIDTNKWFVQSSSTEKKRYIVAVNTSSSCLGCPLACPACSVCVHQFTCSCVDYMIKGNFCKHLHACIRKSNWHTMTLKEEDATSALPEHNKIVVQSSEGQSSVHVGESVSMLTRITVLLHSTMGVTCTATNEALSEATRKIEEAFEILKRGQINSSEELHLPIPQFPELRNLPSHKNIEQQRFFSTKKKQKPRDVSLSKPTEMQKFSIQAAMGSVGNISETIHTDCDHDYYK